MRKGFTLAEVLITLTIIGVIAALTIPNLMKKWEDAHTVSGVKEAYSLLDNAMKQVVREEGYLTELSWPETGEGKAENAVYLRDKLSQYLKIEKNNCSAANKCLPSPYKTLSNLSYQGSDVYLKAGTVLKNGMIMAIDVAYPRGYNIQRSTYIGKIFVDINGKKGPNRFGYDAFFFIFNKDGMNNINSYVENAGGNDRLKKTSCNYKATTTSPDGYVNGTSCQYWIMKHGNVDYKYRDVSAEW